MSDHIQGSNPTAGSSNIAVEAPRTSERADELPSLSPPNIIKREATAREVFVAWEKLRFIYNVILLFGLFYVVIPLADGMGEEPPIFNHPVPNIFLVWNVCFCIGAVGEGYLCLFRIPRRIARWTMFFLLTMVMTVVNGTAYFGL
jgi:hypothetical protein